PASPGPGTAAGADQSRRPVAPAGHADHLAGHRSDSAAPAGRSPKRPGPHATADPRTHARGGCRGSRRVPAPAGFPPGARAATNRTLESGRLHQRGDRDPNGLRAAHDRAQGEPHSLALETRVRGAHPMNPERPSSYEQLSPEAAARVDAVCDGFEKAWKEARSEATAPRLWNYLDGYEGQERTILAEELQVLDRACRERYVRAVRPGDFNEPGALNLAPTSPDHHQGRRPGFVANRP